MANQRNPHHKRHGHHQKRSNKFLKVYHPFLPLLLIISGLMLLATLVSPKYKTNSGVATVPQSEGQVLAYATNISTNGLLDYTNQRRQSASVGKLSLNSKLMAAAQSKANDMAKRNYWSHDTPNGTPPWSFITKAGYSYSRAGENLACGFNNSQDVITGWYHSPTHRANLLNKYYKDVGFGVANADKYDCGDIETSKQTIIVAMYGTPYSIQQTSKNSSSKTFTVGSLKSASKLTSQTVTSHNLTIAVTDQDEKPVKGIKVTIHSDVRSAVTNSKGEVIFKDLPTGKHKLIVESKGVKSESDIDLTNVSKDFRLDVLEPNLLTNQTVLNEKVSGLKQSPDRVNRLDILTSGRNKWLLAFLLFSASIGVFYVVAKHSLAVHRFLIKGDRYIHKHKLIDFMVLLLLIALFILTRTVGSIL